MLFLAWLFILLQAPEVLHEVRGLRWGSYAGSPADDRPILALVQTLKSPASHLASLSSNELLLMPPRTHVLSTGVNKGLAISNYILEFVYMRTSCNLAIQFHSLCCQVWKKQQCLVCQSVTVYLSTVYVPDVMQGQSDKIRISQTLWRGTRWSMRYSTFWGFFLETPVRT